jgi:hypothetical protein
MLVSKIQTYLSDKMHLKKVVTNKHAKLGLTQKINEFLIVNLFVIVNDCVGDE